MNYLFDDFGFYAGTSEVETERTTTVSPPLDDNGDIDASQLWNFNHVEWVGLPLTYQRPIVAHTGVAPIANPTEWLIDIGPFFDRFGAAKMSILTSANATVKAIVTDVMVRKWVDLRLAAVADALDALIALGVSGMTPALKTSILDTPVAPEENTALRTTYFSP